jgi:hypothetical protein
MEPAEYCREIETYLCRKNGGHLVRIVGPAFEQVSGWAAQGIPLTLVYRGIDRYCERRRRRGGAQRRPARIEFCESDVLELFDDWRRALGLNRAAAVASEPGSQEEEARQRRRRSLPAHVDRLILRLSSLAATADGELSVTYDRVLRELDGSRAAARARSEARARLIERLARIDRELLEAVRRATPPATLEALRAEGSRELASFLSRMSEEARERALDACVDRLLRAQAGLPAIAFE